MVDQAYKEWEKDASAVEALLPAVERHREKNVEREGHEQAVAATADDAAGLLLAWQAYIQFEV